MARVSCALFSPMIGLIDLIEFRMTSNTKHLAQLQYGASQYNHCLGTRSNVSSYYKQNQTESVLQCLHSYHFSVVL